MIGKKNKKINRIYDALDTLLDSSYQSGYLSGAVAAAVGDVIVERRDSGFYVRGKGEGEVKDVSKDTAVKSR